MRCWQFSSLICDVQCQRELFYKRFYLTNRILDVGIDLTCKNFDRFLQLKKTTDVATSVDVNFCLTEDEIRNANIARFTVSRFSIRSVKKSGHMAERLLLLASLVNNNEIVCNLRCLLKRKTNGNEVSFVVTHFTLSSSL